MTVDFFIWLPEPGKIQVVPKWQALRSNYGYYR